MGYNWTQAEGYHLPEKHPPFCKGGVLFLLGFAFGFYAVEIVDPVSLQEVDQKYDAAERPGNGIGQ